jgi:CRP/FNR family transcriptional regulator
MDLTIAALRQFSLLQAFSDDELEQIRARLSFRSLSANEVLIIEGAASDPLYFVLEGWFKAEKVSREGRQQTLRFVGPGEVLNELSVFSNDPSAVTVIAMEAGMVFSISRSDVEKWLSQSQSFSRVVVRELAKRMGHLLNHIENLSLYPVEVRLARFLLEEADRGVVERQTWKTQTEIANQLGTVLDVVNRQLQKFARQGIIDLGRDQIKVIDQERLEKIARG